MPTPQDDLLLPDTSRIGSRMSRISPDIFRNQDTTPTTNDDKEESVETEENVFSDEPIDDDGNPTDMSDNGEQENQPDDNNALGDYVTQLGSV
ncbi:hypothetical protein [Spirosoma spitsbergense]|jgi:hypothetical protein|uniref:hypothetical protein n=1 Tax=Spirosoma spitsbergense TaxID=431554 RepID=UPI000476F3DE|nr:hypothetical protein [Spirosoma spitsbergense]